MDARERMRARASRAKGTVSIRLVWPFLELARAAGHTQADARAREWLALTDEQLRDPETRVPLSRIAALLTGAIERTGNRDIGLLAARHVAAAHTGITEYVARSRATLREAIESSVRYSRLLGDLAHHSLVIEGKLAYFRLWLDPELPIHEAAYEYVFALGLLSARRITGIADLAPLEVHFMHREPTDVTPHKKLFRCRLRFGMPIAQVVMRADSLAAPLAGAEPALGELLERQADAMLARLPRSKKTAARVRAALRSEASLRAVSASRIATRLGMSVRTLSRKLDAEGTSYRALFDEVRKQVAIRDLTQSARAIAEIAHGLGFASSQSFHRAFRRWTGSTAAAHRARARERRRRPTRRPTRGR